MKASGEHPIEFSPVAAEHFPLLLCWLHEPHVGRFYKESVVTLADVAAKYGPRGRGEALTWSHVASGGGAPFGYIQCYRLLDYPDYAALIEVTDGIGVDLYIGEPGLIGRGLGRAMLAAYLKTVAFPAYPDERRAYIAHALDNRAALACSLSVGFQPVRRVLEEGVWEQLLCLEREAGH